MLAPAFDSYPLRLLRLCLAHAVHSTTNVSNEHSFHSFRIATNTKGGRQPGHGYAAAEQVVHRAQVLHVARHALVQEEGVHQSLRCTEARDWHAVPKVQAANVERSTFATPRNAWNLFRIKYCKRYPCQHRFGTEGHNEHLRKMRAAYTEDRLPWQGQAAMARAANRLRRRHGAPDRGPQRNLPPSKLRRLHHRQANRLARPKASIHKKRRSSALRLGGRLLCRGFGPGCAACAIDAGIRVRWVRARKLAIVLVT